MEKSLKILISNDCVEFDKHADRIFKRYSMNVSFVEKDGLKIIESIESLQPDIAVFDLFNPNADAVDIIKAVKRSANIKNPEFIVISKFENQALKKELAELGALCLITKPINPSELVANIVHLYSKRKRSLDKDANLNNYSENMQNHKSIELQVTEILHQIGVPAHIKGYHYLRAAIITAIQHPEIINAVTKQLYPSVAKEFSTTSSRVERAIRHAIEVAWDRGDMDILNSYFGYTIHTSRGKPTNSEFIAMISDKLRLQLKSAS